MVLIKMQSTELVWKLYLKSLQPFFSSTDFKFDIVKNPWQVKAVYDYGYGLKPKQLFLEKIHLFYYFPNPFRNYE